jgi:hypothetical protein
MAGHNEQGEHDVYRPDQHLGDHHLLLAVVAVGDATRERRQHEDWDGLDAVHQAELDGELVSSYMSQPRAT